MKKSMPIFAVLTVILLFMTNCNSSEQSSSPSTNNSSSNPTDNTSSEAANIVGKWVLISIQGSVPEDDNTFFIFKEDNTAIENGQLGEFNRTWSIKGNELCLKSIEEGGFEICGAYKLNENQLVWNYVGMETIYEKE